MRKWTPEERKRQSELIKNWQPWKSSTGPKTAEGKERSKMNAYKHGLRGEETAELKAMLSEKKRGIGQVIMELEAKETR